MAYSDWLIDKRVVQRNLHKGLVDPKELDKLTKALPDRTDNIAAPEADEPETDGGDAGDDDGDEG